MAAGALSGAARGAAMDRLLARVRACTLCAATLPLGPRPLLQAGPGARLLVVGHAPGARTHASGLPWDDASGARLRGWLGLDAERFYDPEHVALLSMGFCYPGRGGGGDLPPRRECAPRWLEVLLGQMPQVVLTLALGQHAQRRFLGSAARAGVTATVRAARDCRGAVIPLPHPSPRNTAWFQRHPWFEAEVIPRLRQRVQGLLG